MLGPACTKCGYVHPAPQVCPKRLFQVRLGLKDSGKSFGCIIINYDTKDDQFNKTLSKQYGKYVGVWTRTTRVYCISWDLYTVSELDGFLLF